MSSSVPPPDSVKIAPQATWFLSGLVCNPGHSGSYWQCYTLDTRFSLAELSQKTDRSRAVYQLPDTHGLRAIRI